MPLPEEIIIPKTTDANEFEDMVCDVSKVLYKREFQKYGRKGQKQSGVDIISTDSEELIAIQCKNYKITPNDICKMIKDTNGFQGAISELIIATSTDRDTKVQDCIRELNQNGEFGFHVSIMFWDEIECTISQKETLLATYYPTINKDSIEWLIAEFNQLIKEYDILGFVNVDPVIGMPEDYPLLVDSFVGAMGQRLLELNVLQQHPKFCVINSFRDMIDIYNGYLSTKLFPAVTRYTIQNPCDLEDVSRENSKIKSEVLKYKKELDELYGQINEGCSMFVVRQ